MSVSNNGDGLDDYETTIDGTKAVGVKVYGETRTEWIEST